MTFSLDDSLGFIVNRTANALKAAIEHDFVQNGFNITAEQWAVLSCLSEEDGLSQQRIVNRISKDKTNVARILALMERRQLIERRVDPDDHRMRNSYLTPLGRLIHKKLLVSTKQSLERALNGLSQDH